MIKNLVARVFGFKRDAEIIQERHETELLLKSNEVKNRNTRIDELENTIKKQNFLISNFEEIEGQKNELMVAYNKEKLLNEKIKNFLNEVEKGPVSFYTEKLISHAYPDIDLTTTKTDSHLPTIFFGAKEEDKSSMTADLAVVNNNETFIKLCKNHINRWGNLALKSSTVSTDPKYWLLRGYTLGLQSILEELENAAKSIDNANEPDEEFDVDEILPE